MKSLSIPALEALVGSLGSPSKMPGFSYGLSAHDCIVGSLLRKVAGSTCSKCYALKGQYSFPVVRKAHAFRLASLSKPYWTAAITELIRRRTVKVPWFRLHDSGDIQSLDHLEKIVLVAKNLPKVKFWLPSRERAIVKEWLEKHPEGFPTNLCVRMSAPLIGRAPEKIAGTVGSSVDNPAAFQCKAPAQGNKCLKCRACWSNKVPEVSYHKH